MTAATPRSRPRAVSLWRRPLLVGVCFGLGYGITQRLLDLRLPQFVSWGQSFDVRETPGTSLESLRLRHGSNLEDLRSTGDPVELQADHAKETAKPDTPAQDTASITETDQLPDAGDGARTAPSPASAPAAPQLPPPATSQP